jgi:hypothetical protein
LPRYAIFLGFSNDWKNPTAIFQTLENDAITFCVQISPFTRANPRLLGGEQARALRLRGSRHVRKKS